MWGNVRVNKGIIMKFYIAAQDQNTAKEVAKIIFDAGHEVTKTYSKNERMQIAIDDEKDILSCDALILCSGVSKCSGGKFVEVGIALGKRKLIYILGHRENMLLWHPLCAQFNNIEDLMQHIEKPTIVKEQIVLKVDAYHSETKAPCDDCGNPTYNLHAASGIRLCDKCVKGKAKAMDNLQEFLTQRPVLTATSNETKGESKCAKQRHS
jgi:hypothetical protein